MSAIDHRRLRNLLLIIAPLMATQSLCAAEDAENFYIGLGVGVAQISEDFILIDDSSTAYKALIGYELNDHVSLEASFVTLDDYEAYNPFVVDTQQAVADGRGLNAAAVLTLPLARHFSLNARVGVLFWNADSESASIESDGSDLSFGLGLNFSVSEVLSIRLDYDALNFGDVDANVGTVALQYRF